MDSNAEHRVFVVPSLSDLVLDPATFVGGGADQHDNGAGVSHLSVNPVLDRVVGIPADCLPILWGKCRVAGDSADLHHLLNAPIIRLVLKTKKY